MVEIKEVPDSIRLKLTIAHSIFFLLFFCIEVVMKGDPTAPLSLGIYLCYFLWVIYKLVKTDYASVATVCKYTFYLHLAGSILVLLSGYSLHQQHSRYGGVPDYLYSQILVAIMFQLLLYYTIKKLACNANNLNAYTLGRKVASLFGNPVQKHSQPIEISFEERKAPSNTDNQEAEDVENDEPKIAADLQKNTPLKGSALKELHTKYSTGITALKYRDDAANVRDNIRQLPPKFIFEMLRRLTENPQANVEGWTEEFLAIHKKETEPFDSLILNEKFTKLKKIDDTAAQEFVKAVNLLGATVDPEKIYEKLKKEYDHIGKALRHFHQSITKTMSYGQEPVHELQELLEKDLNKFAESLSNSKEISRARIWNMFLEEQLKARGMVIPKLNNEIND